jgi:hypothetical protein
LSEHPAKHPQKKEALRHYEPRRRFMEAVQSNHVQEERVAFRQLLWVGPLAAAAAAVANAFVYLVASVSGAMPQDFVVNGQGPITLVVVAAVSAQGAVAGAVVYTLIGWFARRPVRVFRIVAAVALVLSFATPLTIPGAPTSMVLTLELMHVVAALVIVSTLTTLARKR